MNNPITLEAASPAKINLFLHITGRRADGYHLLESIFCPISLCDQVRLRLEPKSLKKGVSASDLTLQRWGPLAELPEVVDLTARACKAFFNAAPHLPAHQIEISVHKRIPAQAGLGGGSSNAATVLRLLQTHFSHPLKSADLAKVALSLGADVPFFLQDEPAFVEGIGEQLTPLQGGLGRRSVPLLVYKPPQNCPTAQIFNAQQLTRDSSPVKIAVFDSWQREFGLYNRTKDRASGVIGHTSFTELDDYWQVLKKRTRNSLQAVVEQLSPEWLSQFRQFVELTESCEAKLVRMTGSGSAMFAVFEKQEDCDKAQAGVEKQMQATSKVLFKSQIIGSGSESKRE